MTAAQTLACRDCGAALRHVDGRYVCPQCGAEVHLDERGEEIWQTARELAGPLQEVAA